MNKKQATEWKTSQVANNKNMCMNACPACKSFREDTKEYWLAINIPTNTSHYICKSCYTKVQKAEFRELRGKTNG